MPNARGRRRPGRARLRGADRGTPEPSLGPTVTEPPIPPWDGQERLNILLIGADEQGGAHNTDTMITVSIDPQTNQIVMFQLPRDTVDVPIPPGPAQSLFGSVYQGKINSLVLGGRRPPRLLPGHPEHARLQRPQGHPRATCTASTSSTTSRSTSRVQGRSSTPSAA